MILPEDGERIVQTILTPIDDLTVEFRFTSIGAGADDTWRTHMVGMARREDPARIAEAVPFQFAHVRQRCASSIPVDRYYEAMRTLGLEYGASFRAIEMLQRGDGEVLTRVQLPLHLSADHQSGLHPALLDACLHLYPTLVDAYGDFTKEVEEPRRVYLPVSVARFRCAGIRAREVWAHGLLRQVGNGSSDPLSVDIAIYLEDGSVRSRNRRIVAKTIAAGSISITCHDRNRVLRAATCEPAQGLARMQPRSGHN